MKRNIYLPILIFTSVAFGLLMGQWLNYPDAGTIAAPENTYRTKLNRLIDFIESEYVDDVDTDSIVNVTVDNILAKLDPHSVYIPPSEQSGVAEYMKGDFIGIGVNFYMYNDTVAIIKPVENGPSAKAGLKAGDRILYAGSRKLFGEKLPSDSLFSILKGREGTKVNLTIYRKLENKRFNVSVTRDVVAIKSVDAAVMLNEKTGYIKINRFAETTFSEFKAALSSLQKKGISQLVIDVRDNGGGYMDPAIAIADELLKDDELIVFTKNKKGRIDKTYATSKGSFENGKVFILINESSASASEILAGAIQDNDRGIVIGRRSFGKGLVQREMEFGDGSAVRLTVARYYTPSGRSIQKHYDEGVEAYFGDFAKRFDSGELYEKDSIKIADTLKFKTKRGRIVYGGGGIVPDVFVPLDKNHGQFSISYLMQSGIVGYFVFEQLDRNRALFAGKSYADFLEEIKTSETYYNAFTKYMSDNGLTLQFDSNKAMVKRYLAAEFARQLYSDDKYFEIVIMEDEMIKAVLERD